MMCYKDMTFCPYHDTCQSGPTCYRALTDKVREGAEKWWGGDDYPIALFSSPPTCYIPITRGDEDGN